MPRLRLKFPDRGQSVPHIDFSILLIGLLVLAGVLLQFRQVTEEVNHWTNRVERLEKQQQQKAAPRTRSTPRIKEFSQEIRKEITQANAILDQINLPWETLFDAIEHAATEEIALLSLQPNVASRTLRLSGEAKSMSELLDFVEALERELVFENVHLLNYKVKQDNPHRPIIFLLTAAWMQVS
ncbi:MULTISPECIES: PilN domain-containing protein [Nitrosomonas]|uniref:Fimbrial assembly protein (PilN) n=1 Tax=Nitrosomonas oligotropha TaxID=42354 RepID=A0A1H8SGB3_9PROT|nr:MULTISPECIES: PilN domain-containing protein [Nitrosomonas]UJO99267.1 MAG: PilN domain-containing protein [Nitrosomonas sp.]MDV6342679.1 PilN domain-containing protein [Nitrosomonas sp. Is24]PTQ76667.1 fimbrial assembly protein PilN [Nitrosomonas oligotropha]SDX13086.1 Fimbrial assembly protein (PilN) [Nitrosomonas oligotropha]SEO77338.1 Fimbrial assembly protein (PilN) [Nitrosomonas oligotropha]